MSPLFLKNYEAGHKAGHADALNGISLTVARVGNPRLPGYAEGYSAGQRAALTEERRSS